MSDTISQYNSITEKCKSLFIKKHQDYGSAWRYLRTSSLTDQIYIKAKRIRTIQETEISKIEEGIEEEFIGIYNYSLMALVQLDLGPSEIDTHMDAKKLEQLYDKHRTNTFELMQAKNHDYGEAWRSMRVSSITDLILQKLLRVKQIEDNQGATIVSEGLEANFQDMMNYAVFAMILINE